MSLFPFASNGLRGGATTSCAGRDGPASRKAVVGRCPGRYEQNAVRDPATRRFTTTQEVADLIVFLASDRAANITGAE